MAITQDDVNRIAIGIAATGITPTVDSVIMAFGSGSKTTVTPMLRAWKASNSKPTPESTALPAEINAAILKYVTKEVTDAITTLQAQLTETQQQLDGVIKESTDRQTTIDELADKLAVSAALKSNMEGAMAELRKQVASEKTRADKALEDLQNARINLARTEGLKDLLTSAQAELTTLKALKK